MTLNELLVIMQNRLLSLNEARKAAVNAGDPEKVVQIDNDILTTNMSISAILSALNPKD